MAQEAKKSIIIYILTKTQKGSPMSEINKTNQNDNQSAFDSILNKYTDLLLEVDKLRNENANIHNSQSGTNNDELKKESVEQFSSSIYVILNQIKSEISQINKLLSESNEPKSSTKPRKRKKKSSSKSLMERIKASIGLTKN